MRDSVRAAFVSFTEKFEGEVNTMYRDVKNLVTIGIGNLIDPIGAALDLPFVKKDGSLASRSEIGAEWRLIKTTPGLDIGGWKAAAKIATLHLTPEGVSQLVQSKLLANEKVLAQRFSNYADWPADGQLMVHSLAWACGSQFRFPKLETALHNLDFRTAAVECQMNAVGNPGLKPRNLAQHILANNAAYVIENGMCRDDLHYPNSL